MKFFRNIFSAKSEPQTLEDRLQLIKDKSPSELDDIFMGTAGDPEDLELRLALVEKASQSVLVQIAGAQSQNASLVKAARQRLAAMVDSKEIPTTALISAVSDTEELLTIAAFSATDDFHTQVLNGIEDQVLIGKLCGTASSSKVRQLLASKVEDENELKALAKTLKNKDKSAYKIIKAKLDVLREIELQHKTLQNSAQQLVDEMQYLAKRAVDKETQPRYERLQRRWSELGEGLEAESVNAFTEQAEICKKALDQFLAAIAEENALQEQINKAGDNRAKIISDLWGLVSQIYGLAAADEAALTSIREQASEKKSEWDTLKQLDTPTKHHLRDYTNICESIEVLLGEYVTSGSAIECYRRVESAEEGEPQKSDIQYLRKLLSATSALQSYPLSETASQVSRLLNKVDADFVARKEEKEKATRGVSALIRKATQAVEQGRIKQAIGVRHSIDEKLALMEAVPSFLPKKIEELDEAIQKLVDWQSYAVVPKKQALVDAMEKLVDSDIPAEALATKIKKLQNEWKGLSQSGKDRQEQLWEQFSAYADKAYEPCKKYYDELSESRKHNLLKRQELVKSLRDFDSQYQWESADWKYVEQIIRGARKEFHSYSPVERAANKTVSLEFDEAFQQLQDKLDAEYAKNKSSKEILIGQAEKLAELADTDQAIEGVKRLQAQWKSIGRCHHKDNDALWKSFRVFCDKIFEDKTQKEGARRAAVDEVINNARGFVTSIQSLVEKSGEALLAARAERDQLQTDFAVLEDIPEKVHKAIERDFNKGVDAFDKKVAKCLRETQSHAWNDFFAACEKINHYHNCVLTEESSNDVLREEVENFIEGVSQWPEGGQNFVKQKLLQVTSEPDANTEENLKALKLLCIRSEILADQETPETDKQLRMEYQVQLLQKGLGAQRMEENSSISIAKEWCCVGPVSEDQYKALFDRFYTSWRSISA